MANIRPIQGRYLVLTQETIRESLARLGRGSRTLRHSVSCPAINSLNNFLQAAGEKGLTDYLRNKGLYIRRSRFRIADKLPADSG